MRAGTVALADRETPATAIETLIDAVEPAPRAETAAPRRAGWWLATGVLLACVPLVRMMRWVLGGSAIPYNDYWLMIDEVLLPSGGLRIQELGRFSNDHPVVIPKLIYWLNLHNTGGSNIVLGLVVIAVVAVQLALFIIVLRRGGVGNAAGAAVLVVAASLLYSRLGAWNFLKAMSGTAWLTANTFAVAALVARWRGRAWSACGLGVLACLCYGTGLAVWPALLATGMLTDRRIRRQWPTAVVGLGVVVAYLAGRSSGDAQTDVATPGKLVRYALEVMSAPLVPFDFGGAVWVGAAILGAAVAVTVAAIRLGHGASVAPWLGVSLYGATASFLVALGRADFVLGFGSNRHFSLGALTIVGAVGMLATIGKRIVADEPPTSAVRPIAGACVLAIVAGGITATAWFADRSELDNIQHRYASQDRLAIGLLFRLVSGTREALGGFDQMPDGIEDLLDSNDHVPFRNESFDCGLAGSSVDLDAVGDLPDGVTAKLVRPARDVERSGVAAGWLRDPTDLVGCIVVLDGSGVVIGAGAIGPPDEGYGPSQGVPRGADGFVTVQPNDTDDAIYLLVLRDGTFAAVPEAEESIRF